MKNVLIYSATDKKRLQYLFSSPNLRGQLRPEYPSDVA
jgi:hypothetical protein